MPVQRQRPPWIWVVAVWVVAMGVVGVTSSSAAPPPQPDTNRYWTTTWSFQDIDVKRFKSRLESIGLTIPLDADGDVSIEFRVSVPLKRLRDAKAYRFQGRMTAKRLRLESLLLRDFSANLRYDDGLLVVQDLRGTWIEVDRQHQQQGQAGTLAGQATLQLVPLGDLQAELKAQSLPIAPLERFVTRRVARSDDSLGGGTLSGRIEASVPIERLKEIKAWIVEGDLAIHDLRLSPTIPLTVVTGPVRVQQGVVLAQRIAVTASSLPESRVELATQIELCDTRRCEFHLRASDVPLGAISQLVSSHDRLAEGSLDLDVTGRAELASATWSIVGQLATPELTVLGEDFGLLEHQFVCDQEHFLLQTREPSAANDHDSIRLHQIAARYQLSESMLRFSSLRAQWLGAEIEGHATVARNDTLAHQAHLSWRNLPTSLASARFLPARLRMTARTSGTIDWAAPATALASPAGHSVDGKITLQQIELGQLDVGQLELSLVARQGTIQLAGGGQLLGGSLTVEAVRQVRSGESWSALLTRLPSGRVTAENLSLDSIARFMMPDARRHLRGSVNVDIDLSEAESTLEASIGDLAIDRHPISRQLLVRGSLRDDALWIDRAGGNLAGGRVSASGVWSLRGGPRRVQVRLAGVRAGDLVTPIFDQLSDRIEGQLSGSLTTTVADTIRLRGSLTAHDSSVGLMRTGTIHTAIDGALSPDLQRWKVVLRSIRGDLAGGRITGDAVFASSANRKLALTSQWNLHRVDFGQLLASAGVTQTIAHGRISGHLSLGARSADSIRDLRGRFDARLGSTQAAAVPGLMKADQWLGVFTLGGVRFDEGRLEGVIGGGAAKIDQLWLTSDHVKVWSDGRVQLGDGRMDLDVIISTGNAGATTGQKLASFAAQLAVQSVLPVATLVEINQLLANRTIHLDFTGPLSDPRVRLKPLEIIREEAARFLIRELLVAASASTNRW